MSDFATIERAIRDGRCITRGTLNDTYQATVHGVPVFVRSRNVFDTEYGQTFAGERFVPQGLQRALGVPRLLDVVNDASGRERFAVFELIPDLAPISNPHLEPAFADSLALIHAHKADRLGPVLGPFTTGPTEVFIAGIVMAELTRLRQQSPAWTIFAALEENLQSVVEVFVNETPCLIHGDVHAANFLMDAEGSLRVLDWEATRYRVAASDFNQLQVNWLSRESDHRLIERYCASTRRDRVQFLDQVLTLRILWFLRTYNFETGVLGRVGPAPTRWLNAAVPLVQQVLRRVGVR